MLQVENLGIFLLAYKAIRYGVINLIRSLLPESRFQQLNRRLLVAQGAVLADDTVVYSSVKVSRMVRLVVGSGSFIGSNSVFTGGAGSTVHIGRDCDISNHVHFVTGTHEIGTAGIRRAGSGLSKNISVGDGVWIGYRSLLLPGVRIGRGAIIAAGSVVVQDIPEDVLAGGVPCRQLKNLPHVDGAWL